MIDYNDIGEKNGDGEEVQNARVSKKVTLRMGRPLLAYLAYYAERFDGDSSLADPEAICLAKEEKKEFANFFMVPYGCEEERSVGECVGGGERLVKMLGMDLKTLNVYAVMDVVTSYFINGIDGVAGSFMRGTEATRTAACYFLEALHRVLSEQEGRDCWPEVSEEAEEKFFTACRRRLTPLHRRFGITLCGEARFNRLTAA